MKVGRCCWWAIDAFFNHARVEVKAQGHDFMGGLQVQPISGLSPELLGLLKCVLEHVEDKKMVVLLEALVESRLLPYPSLLGSHERLRDLIFLDLSLDSTIRTATERGYAELRNIFPLDFI